MSDPASDLENMALAVAVVAGLAAPVAFVCGVWVRRQSGSLWPRWQSPRFVWTGQVVFAFFVLALVAPYLLAGVADAIGAYSILYSSGLRGPSDEVRATEGMVKVMWARLAIAPLLLGTVVALRHVVFGSPIDWGKGVQDLPRAVCLGTLGLFTFGFAAFGVNLLVEVGFRQIGWSPDEHPLSKMGATGDGVGGLLFVLSACVAAPMLEEFTFRGLLVPWASGRRHRPWLLTGYSAGVILLLTKQPVAPLILLAVLAGVQQLVRWPGVRTGRAIWSTSMLFAFVHSAVWPSPIPLFVLALGLGYLTARTRSWAAATVTHALFNTVSTVYVFSRG